MGKKILIVRSSSLGDIIHALPVAKDIKEAFPDARLDWVSEESFASVCSLSPYIDKTVKTAFRRWRKSPFSSRTISEIRDLRRELRDAQYDVVVDIQGLVRSALVTKWSRAPSFGYSRDTIKEPLASFFYDTKVPVSGKTGGPVLRYRKMASICLGYETDLDCPTYGLRATAQIPCELPERFAAVFVSTSADRKLWQDERWSRSLQLLADGGLESVLFWGNEGEKARAQRIAGTCSGIHVLPRLSLPQVGSIVSRAVIGMGVDTGLTHLSAALGIPTLGIWLDTDPDWIGLVGEKPCPVLGGKRLDVSVEAAVRAAQELSEL